MHKSGFVNIVGNPNVGKSTLMNALVGERISIITSKAQTTRHRILGIVNGDDFQIVYSDTPGVLKPNYRLQESMLNFSRSALTDADVLLYVTDVFDSYEKNEDFVEKVKLNPAPLLLIINKIDLIDEEKLVVLVEKWKELLPKAEIYPVSATDKPARFFVTEIIREKILLNYDKEIPYSVEVEVEQFQEDDRLIRINAVIYAERDSQKGILIGHGGKSLKKVGTEARKDMEVFFDKKVFLELYVKVEKDWRNKDIKLKGFGYSLD